MQSSPANSYFANFDNAQSALNASSSASNALEIGHSVNDDFSFDTQFPPNSNKVLENSHFENAEIHKSIESVEFKTNELFKAQENSQLKSSDFTQSPINSQLENANSHTSLEISAENSQSLVKSPKNSAFASSELDYNVDYSDELKKEIAFHQKRGRDFKPILEYNKKEFSQLIFPNFTAMDFNLFMCFCFITKEKGRAKIKVSFEDLNYLMGLGERKHKDGKEFTQGVKIDRNPKRLFQNFDKFVQKALQTVIKITQTDGKYATNRYTGFFDFINIYEKEKVIVIAFNELMVKALNGFSNYYTRLELKQYCSLNSKYSKLLYTLLMDNLYKKEPLKIGKDELIRYFGLKGSVKQTNLNALLKSIIDEFMELCLFSSLEIVKTLENRKVIAYNFVYSK